MDFEIRFVTKGGIVDGESFSVGAFAKYAKNQ